MNKAIKLALASAAALTVLSGCAGGKDVMALSLVEAPGLVEGALPARHLAGR